MERRIEIHRKYGRVHKRDELSHKYNGERQYGRLLNGVKVKRDASRFQDINPHNGFKLSRYLLKKEVWSKKHIVGILCIGFYIQ